ncbi:MAG: hypothetical protein AAF721_24095 [Myxococcota bacterium]
MRSLWLVVGGLAGLALACGTAGAFVCTSDDQCEVNGESGQCEMTGYCSFADDTCPSGRRYGAHAGAGLSGTCTDAPVGAGTGTGAAPAVTGGASDGGTEVPPSLSDGPDTTASTSAGDTSEGGTETTSATGDACGAPGQPCCSAPPCPGGGACVEGMCEPCRAAVVAGENFTCALTNAGRLDCWGQNQNGQLGDGTETSRFESMTVMDDLVAFDLGSFHALAIDTQGTLWGWGRNADGQLDLALDGEVLAPTALALDVTPVVASGGARHSCIADETGLVTCWGANVDGQTGAQGNADQPPTLVPEVMEAVGVELGSHHSCAFGDVVRCFGRNNYSQLGSESQGSGPDPVTVPLVAPSQAVAARDHHTCALDVDGNVWCWGRDDFGQTGDGSDGGEHGAPTAVVGLPATVSIATGTYHSCAVSDAGEVYCWGRNHQGQLGVPGGQVAEAQLVSGVQDAIDVTAGDSHTCAATDGGEVWCWGRNNSGALGVKDGGRNTPVLSSFVCERP